jgi:hypothetical protein
MKSFQPKEEAGGTKPPAGGDASPSGDGAAPASAASQDGTAPVAEAASADRNAEVNFHGQKRSNETHASRTDPEARLYRKGPGKEAKLCFMSHALMENRSGLIVEACLTEASGHAERVAALAMIEPRADRPDRITLGADKGYDTEDFLNELRSMSVTPHVAAKVAGSAIDRRTTRHAGYATSQRIRKRIEEAFDWSKTIGPSRPDHAARHQARWRPVHLYPRRIRSRPPAEIARRVTRRHTTSTR